MCYALCIYWSFDLKLPICPILDAFVLTNCFRQLDVYETYACIYPASFRETLRRSAHRQLLFFTQVAHSPSDYHLSMFLTPAFQLSA